MIRIDAGRRSPVSVRDGFEYITDPRNWLAYWPRAITVDPGHTLARLRHSGITK